MSIKMNFSWTLLTIINLISSRYVHSLYILLITPFVMPKGSKTCGRKILKFWPKIWNLKCLMVWFVKFRFHQKKKKKKKTNKFHHLAVDEHYWFGVLGYINIIWFLPNLRKSIKLQQKVTLIKFHIVKTLRH